MKISDKLEAAYKVDDEHRTSHLSKQPGGAAVYVEFNNGVIKHYENVKYPDAYMKRIWDTDVKKKVRDIWTM